MPRPPRQPRRFAVSLVLTPGASAVDRRFVLANRPAFKKNALAIAVVGGTDEDAEHRRHILHWDRHLKPMIQKITTGLLRDKGARFPSYLEQEMRAAGIKQIRDRTPQGLVKRLAEELNSAPGNLVADDAATNMAIEVVRANLNKYLKHLQGLEQFNADLSPTTATDTNTPVYLAAATQFFETKVSADASHVAKKVAKLNKRVLRLLQSCIGPSSTWLMIHNLNYSVTFDLSPKSSRDQIDATMRLQRDVKTCLAGENYEDALQRLMHLLEI